MKNLLLVLMTIIILTGTSFACELATNELIQASKEAVAEADAQTWNEFLKLKTLYADWDHLWYSWWGYRNRDFRDLDSSLENEWWGVPQFYNIPESEL